MQFRTINFTYDSLSQRRILCVNISTRDDKVDNNATSNRYCACSAKERHLKITLNKYNRFFSSVFFDTNRGTESLKFRTKQGVYFFCSCPSQRKLNTSTQHKIFIDLKHKRTLSYSYSLI